MTTRRLMLASGLVAALALAAPAQDLTLDQIAAKNLDALGGAAAIEAIKTQATTAKIVIQGGMMEAPMALQTKRPNKIRTEITIQGRQIVTAWDGTAGWMINPLTGSNEPQKMDENMAKSMRQSADFEMGAGALALMQKRGLALELLGKEDVEGSPAYKVKVTRKEGDPVTFFIDTASFLPVKIISKVNQMGQELEVESFPSNYKKTGGVMIPFVLDQKLSGKSMMQMNIEKIDINPAIDDSIFAMPAPKAEEKKPEEKKQ